MVTSDTGDWSLNLTSTCRVGVTFKIYFKHLSIKPVVNKKDRHWRMLIDLRRLSWYHFTIGNVHTEFENSYWGQNNK